MSLQQSWPRWLILLRDMKLVERKDLLAGPIMVMLESRLVGIFSVDAVDLGRKTCTSLLVEALSYLPTL